MIDNKGGASIREVVYQLAIKLHESVCICCRSTSSLHGFCISSQRQGPWGFASHITSVSAHQFNLFIHSKPHGYGCFKSTRQCTGHHQIKSAHVLPYRACQSDTCLIQMITRLKTDGVTTDLKSSHLIRLGRIA